VEVQGMVNIDAREDFTGKTRSTLVLGIYNVSMVTKIKKENIEDIYCI
jgi:hypothetical protein